MDSSDSEDDQENYKKEKIPGQDEDLPQMMDKSSTLSKMEIVTLDDKKPI